MGNCLIDNEKLSRRRHSFHSSWPHHFVPSHRHPRTTQRGVSGEMWPRLTMMMRRNDWSGLYSAGPILITFVADYVMPCLSVIFLTEDTADTSRNGSNGDATNRDGRSTICRRGHGTGRDGTHPDVDNHTFGRTSTDDGGDGK